MLSQGGAHIVFPGGMGCRFPVPGRRRARGRKHTSPKAHFASVLLHSHTKSWTQECPHHTSWLRCLVKTERDQIWGVRKLPARNGAPVETPMVKGVLICSREATEQSSSLARWGTGKVQTDSSGHSLAPFIGNFQAPLAL